MPYRSILASLTFAALIAAGAPAAHAAAKDRSPFASDDENPTTVLQAGNCRVRCVDPHACRPEGQKVIDLLHKMVAAYSQGDLKAYERYLDDDCSMFEEGTKKLICGKANCLEELKESFAEHAKGGPKPLVSLTIDQPFAKVTNDTCVVTFTATKEIGGAHPYTERAQITDVFIKRGDEWKKLHWSGNWQKLNAN